MARLYSALIFVIFVLASEEANPGHGCPPSDKFAPCKCSDLSINCDKAKSTDELAKLFNQAFQDFGVFKAVIVNRSEIQFLPSGIFNSMKSKLFYIVHNDKLSSIGENAFEGSEETVKTMILTNNAIERESVFNAVSKLRILKRLHLFGNKITNVPDGALNNLEKLELVNLKDNAISRIGVRAFFNLPSLQHLRLQNNRLTTIGDFAFAFGKAKHPFTTRILLHDNDLVDFRPDSFKGIDRKLTLNLRNNHLTTFPQYVFEILTTFFTSTQDRNSQIIVEGNEFTCDCNMKWIADLQKLQAESTNAPPNVQIIKCEDENYLSDHRERLAMECGSS